MQEDPIVINTEKDRTRDREMEYEIDGERI
jgi:hypothetical protein